MNTIIYNNTHEKNVAEFYYMENPNEKQFETFKKNSIVKIDDTLFISDEQNILK